MRPSFTIGIEEEYQTLDPETFDLRSHINTEIAALIQAAVAKLYKLSRGQPGLPRVQLMENRWRASRYGIDGKLIDFGLQKEVDERQLIHQYLAFVDDVLDEPGSRDEVAHVRTILERGTDADRQLRVYQKTGDRKQVVAYMVEETKAGL